MDIFDFENLKAEKANAMLRYRRLRSIAKLFRLVELCLVLVFLSWISTRLPLAVKISGEYFRLLSTVISSPLFVFVIINVITLTLLANFGRFTGRNPVGNDAETELYEAFVENSETRTPVGSQNQPLSDETAEIVYEDKQIICEVNAITPTREDKQLAMVVKNAETEMETKVYRRIQSENFKRASSKKPCGMLRRSETEKCRKIVISGEEPPEVDGLSNEEFQRFIDEFIAKKTKFHRAEHFPLALQNQS